MTDNTFLRVFPVLCGAFHVLVAALTATLGFFFVYVPFLLAGGNLVVAVALIRRRKWFWIPYLYVLLLPIVSLFSIGPPTRASSPYHGGYMLGLLLAPPAAAWLVELALLPLLVGTRGSWCTPRPGGLSQYSLRQAAIMSVAVLALLALDVQWIIRPSMVAKHRLKANWPRAERRDKPAWRGPTTFFALWWAAIQRRSTKK